MKPVRNLSQLSQTLLLSDHSSPDNDHYRNVILECIILSTVAATASLCLIVFLIYICFHRSNHTSDENPTQPNPSIDVELASIPVLVYGGSTLPSSQPCSSDISLDLETCAICLEDYVHGDRVRVLQRCKHMFHKNCIEQWLLVPVPSLHCPICRVRILEHCLQSAGSNNCSNRRNGIGSSFPLLAFSFGALRYAPYPSVPMNFT